MVSILRSPWRGRSRRPRGPPASPPGLRGKVEAGPQGGHFRARCVIARNTARPSGDGSRWRDAMGDCAGRRPCLSRVRDPIRRPSGPPRRGPAGTASPGASPCWRCSSSRRRRCSPRRRPPRPSGRRGRPARSRAHAWRSCRARRMRSPRPSGRPSSRTDLCAADSEILTELGLPRPPVEAPRPRHTASASFGYAADIVPRVRAGRRTAPASKAGLTRAPAPTAGKSRAPVPISDRPAAWPVPGSASMMRGPLRRAGPSRRMLSRSVGTRDPHCIRQNPVFVPRLGPRGRPLARSPAPARCRGLQPEAGRHADAARARGRLRQGGAPGDPLSPRPAGPRRPDAHRRGPLPGLRARGEAPVRAGQPGQGGRHPLQDRPGALRGRTRQRRGRARPPGGRPGAGPPAGRPPRAAPVPRHRQPGPVRRRLRGQEAGGGRGGRRQGGPRPGAAQPRLDRRAGADHRPDRPGAAHRGDPDRAGLHGGARHDPAARPDLRRHHPVGRRAEPPAPGPRQRRAGAAGGEHRQRPPDHGRRLALPAGGPAAVLGRHRRSEHRPGDPAGAVPQPARRAVPRHVRAGADQAGHRFRCHRGAAAGDPAHRRRPRRGLGGARRRDRDAPARRGRARGRSELADPLRASRPASGSWSTASRRSPWAPR